MNPPRRRPLVLSLPALAVAAGAFGGCARTYEPEQAPRPTALVAYDEAMALRDWPLTEALIASGDVHAGPTNFTRQYGGSGGSDFDSVASGGSSLAGTRRTAATVVDPLLFVGNVLAMPYYVVTDPPWENRTYEGIELDPTYTAAVPVPGERIEPGTVEARPVEPGPDIARPPADAEAEAEVQSQEPTEPAEPRGVIPAPVPETRQDAPDPRRSGPATRVTTRPADRVPDRIPARTLTPPMTGPSARPATQPATQPTAPSTVPMRK